MAIIIIIIIIIKTTTVLSLLPLITIIIIIIVKNLVKVPVYDTVRNCAFLSFQNRTNVIQFENDHETPGAMT